MPFSAPCVSSCVVLRDATLSSSKPFTVAAAGTGKVQDGEISEARLDLFTSYNFHVITYYYLLLPRAGDADHVHMIHIHKSNKSNLYLLTP